MSGCVKIAWVGTEFDTVLSPAVPGPAPPVGCCRTGNCGTRPESTESTLAAYFKQCPNNLSTREALISERGQVDDASSQSLPQAPARLCSLCLPSWVNFPALNPSWSVPPPMKQVRFTPWEIPAFTVVRFSLLPQRLASNSFSGTQMAVAGTPIPNPLLPSRWPGLTSHIQLPTVNAVYVTIPII